jgi:hypothetical protein
MRLTIKSKAERNIQRNLRLPLPLHQRMNATAALADELRVDYHATLLAALEQFDAELNARLCDMQAEHKHPTTGGISADDASIPEPVSPHSNSFRSAETQSITPLATATNHKADA